MGAEVRGEFEGGAADGTGPRSSCVIYSETEASGLRSLCLPRELL